LGAYCRGTARRSAAWCWWWHLGATRVRASHHPVHQRSGAATGGSVHVSGGTPPFFSPMRGRGGSATNMQASSSMPPPRDHGNRRGEEEGGGGPAGCATRVSLWEGPHLACSPALPGCLARSSSAAVRIGGPTVGPPLWRCQGLVLLLPRRLTWLWPRLLRVRVPGRRDWQTLLWPVGGRRCCCRTPRRARLLRLRLRPRQRVRCGIM
jgi:hypothetical protein